MYLWKILPSTKMMFCLLNGDLGLSKISCMDDCHIHKPRNIFQTENLYIQLFKHKQWQPFLMFFLIWNHYHCAELLKCYQFYILGWFGWVYNLTSPKDVLLFIYIIKWTVLDPGQIMRWQFSWALFFRLFGQWFRLYASNSCYIVAN